MTFYARSAPKRSQWEPWRTHVERVLERAKRFGEPLGLAEALRVAAVLHDSGKLSERFMERLAGRAQGLDHWSIGAWIALMKYGRGGLPIALAVQGHHVGLQQGEVRALEQLRPSTAPRRPELTEADPQKILERIEAEGFSLPERLTTPLFDEKTTELEEMLETRLLFSCLIDADHLSAEAHGREVQPGRKAPRPDGLELDRELAGRALERVVREVQTLAAGSMAAEPVNRLRADLFSACHEAGGQAPGLFTLTAPTGSGKTLAMLAFALSHAAEHGHRRIVVALPFLNIIEQNAKVYREQLAPILGADYVLEHHSLAGLKKKDDQDDVADGAANPEAEESRRLLTENWAAPFIVTTTVQLLESLFAHRPMPCRKLHRLAGSILLLDEVQSLPAHLAVPTLGALAHLSRRYGTTVVFATATQPAFDHLDGSVRKRASTAGWTPREIVPPGLELFSRVQRVHVSWEHERRLSWDDLARRLLDEPQALAIVNLKRHARELAEAVERLGGGDGLYHLSTNMCPAHRSARIDTIKTRLARGETCRLVSTQAVEAGVDISFPVVFRALAPLDSIAQAAGRCNRSGELGEAAGRVVVFTPEEEAYPPGGYRQAAEVTRAFLTKHGGAVDLDDPEIYQAYYRTLYELTKVTDKAPKLEAAIEGLDYPEVDSNYRLIDADTIEILVPWDTAEFEALRSELETRGRPDRKWIQRARLHAVSIYRRKGKKANRRLLEPIPLGRGERSEDWFILRDRDAYSEELGLEELEELWVG